MRILCLTSRLPYPPDRGDRLRAYQFLRHLSSEHELALVSFIAHERERELLPHLRTLCPDVQVVCMEPWRSAWQVARHLWRPEPMQVLYYRSERMRRLVDSTLRGSKFDVVYIHLFRMAPYAADRPGPYRILDLTDAISTEVARSLRYRAPASRLLYRIERPRIGRYERWAAGAFEEAWLISEADRRALAPGCPGANLQVVTNGVDTSQFLPLGVDRVPDRLLFVGHLRVFHNVDAVTYLVRDILPLVRRHVPGATLHIVGADPGPAVRRLGTAPGVTLRGYEPDLNAVLNEASLFVAPLRFAAGVQNKVLEAMAAGLPVVTSPLVNTGLGGAPGLEVLVADGPGATADQIVAALRDPAMRGRLAQAGLDFVRRTHRWEGVVQHMRAIQEQLCASL